jgi:hypothetical protein
MKGLIVVFVGMMLVACAAQHPGMSVDAGGKVSYTVECLDDEKNCEPQARELCPDGHVVSGVKSHVVAIWQGVDVVNRIRFWMTVECK